MIHWFAKNILHTVYKSTVQTKMTHQRQITFASHSYLTDQDELSLQKKLPFSKLKLFYYYLLSVPRFSEFNFWKITVRALNLANVVRTACHAPHNCMIYYSFLSHLLQLTSSRSAITVGERSGHMHFRVRQYLNFLKETMLKGFVSLHQGHDFDPCL